MRDAVAEVRRVLRPGGAFILQTQTPQQHRDGFWWAPIIPTASSRLAERFPELDWLEEEVLRPHGFDAFEEHIPSQPLMAIQFYANLGGPLLEEFRNGDSTWGLATEEELDRGLRDWGRRLLEDPVGAAEVRSGEGERERGRRREREGERQREREGERERDRERRRDGEEAATSLRMCAVRCVL